MAPIDTLNSLNLREQIRVGASDLERHSAGFSYTAIGLGALVAIPLVLWLLFVAYTSLNTPASALDAVRVPSPMLRAAGYDGRLGNRLTDDESLALPNAIDQHNLRKDSLAIYALAQINLRYPGRLAKDQVPTPDDLRNMGSSPNSGMMSPMILYVIETHAFGHAISERGKAYGDLFSTRRPTLPRAIVRAMLPTAGVAALCGLVAVYFRRRARTVRGLTQQLDHILPGRGRR